MHIMKRNKVVAYAVSFFLHETLTFHSNVSAFLPLSSEMRHCRPGSRQDRLQKRQGVIQKMAVNPEVNDLSKQIVAASLEDRSEIILNKPNLDESTFSAPDTSLSTNTVNSRLQAEIEQARSAEFQPKTEFGAKLAKSFSYGNRKTDEEREADIAAARDLNGVNPTVTIIASFFAFGLSYCLWFATGWLAEFFFNHPVPLDAPYAFTRFAGVIRNLVMGISSLASGFSGFIGLGVFCLGVRVAYGVITGELDPTPIKKKALTGGLEDDIALPNAWDLMMGKKPGRKGRKN